MTQQAQQTQPAQTAQTAQSSRRKSAWLKITLGVMFVAVLVVGFLGYLTPAMRVSWEAVASMCGF